MVPLNEARRLVRTILEEHASHRPSHGDITPMAIVDEAHDQYQLLHCGWDRTGRVHAVVVHVRIVDGVIWLEQDGTEYGVARELRDAGVPREQIVLAFHPPSLRVHTGYAVGA